MKALVKTSATVGMTVKDVPTPKVGANDNCPTTPNPTQANADGDALGDACDACFGNNATGDPDLDLRCTDRDNCPNSANAAQLDVDGDGTGDTCDVCPGHLRRPGGRGP